MRTIDDVVFAANAYFRLGPHQVIQGGDQELQVVS